MASPDSAWATPSPRPEIADLMHRVRQPFNVNNLALAAATAALDDADFLAESEAPQRRRHERSSPRAASDLGLEWIPSVRQFRLPCGWTRRATPCAVFQALLRNGVIVRPVGNYAMPEYLRVSVGLPEQNARFLTALGEILEAR
jgi:histidinol-phosphate aminotransferase